MNGMEVALIKKLVGLIMLAGVVLGLAATAEAGWLSGWDKRLEVTIDSSKVDSTLTHFPVLLYLSSSSGTGGDDVTAIFDEVGANSKKIAVTKDDGTTQLYVEIEKWDSGSETAWLWVSKSDWTISNSSDTKVYIYYDNDQADNTTYVGDSGSRTEVWDSHAMMVQHLKETSRTAGSYNDHLDSTSNDNDGEAEITPESNMDGTGKINGADTFDGSNDYVNCYDASTQVLVNPKSETLNSKQIPNSNVQNSKQQWKYFSELTKDDEIFTLNPETGKGEWHKPYRYIAYPYKGKMLKIQSEARGPKPKGSDIEHRTSDIIDLLVTPDHQMYVSIKNSKFQAPLEIPNSRNNNAKFLTGQAPNSKPRNIASLKRGRQIPNSNDQNSKQIEWSEFELLKAEEIYGKKIKLLTTHHSLPITILPEEMEWVDYDGMVYDVTVENHILLVRRVEKKNLNTIPSTQTNLNNSNNSLVERTLTRDCRFNSLSSDQSGQFNFNAKAKKSTSSGSGEIFLASDRNLEYSFPRATFTTDLSNLFINRNCVSDKEKHIRILDLCSSISSKEKDGECNSNSGIRDNSLAFERLLKKEKSSFVSTTNFIQTSPIDLSFLNRPRFTSLPSLTSSSSLNCFAPFITLSMNRESNLRFSSNEINSVTSLFILPTSSLSSPGILTTNSGISITSNYNDTTMKGDVKPLLDSERAGSRILEGEDMDSGKRITKCQRFRGLG